MKFTGHILSMNLASCQPSRALKLELVATFMENAWAALRKIVVMYSIQVY